jgi:phosphohistidine phosphatase
MAERRLILMRHAKSDWAAAGHGDFVRPLNARGARDAPRMGRWLKAKGYVPDRIVSSPATRAYQTALHVAEELVCDPAVIVWEPQIYEADLSDLLAVLRRHDPGRGTLLLVGHNPGLEDLLCYLCRQPPPRTGDDKLLTTAAVAVLRCAGRGWEKGAASLLAHARPRELEDG